MAEKFSFRTRPHLLERLKSEYWDLVVIGGGITGAAIARNAALRGLKTALVEADDFASGTSSGSSKLLHGGIRYLENFEFKLVFEAIQEREKLNKLYAPLVKNLDFVFPTFSHRHPSRFLLNMGLTLYDSFSGFKQVHKNLNAKKVKERFSFLHDENLSGACIYTDSFAEDFRLVIEIIKAAYRSGACTVSRLQVEKISSNSEDYELHVKDVFADSNFKIKTKTVFNCTGPYSDSTRKLLKLPPTLKLTQGVHFLVDRKKLPIEQAFVLSDPEHQRILFVIPWENMAYIGTTDTAVKSPDDARAHKEDLDYVLSLFHTFFKIKLERKDILQSWAAVRPLIAPDENKSNSKISRDFVIEEKPANFFHVMGGKLTSHRVMAQDALNRYKDFARDDDPTDLENLITHIAPKSDLKDSIVYSIDNEMALSPLDYIRRRSSMYYLNPSIDAAKNVLSIFAEHLAFSPEKIKDLENQIVEEFEWDQAGY